MGDLTAGVKVAGKYTLVGRVGRGGMGEVWIARNESTGADVAIKTLRPDRRAIDQAEERFRHEARVGAKLHHPNVARVYDLVEAEDGTLLLVMERLRGDTLRARIEAKPITPDEAVEIALPILDALGAAHEAGVIHRDVTPGNIFLSEEGGRVVPKLIDFGVAKTQDQLVTTQSGHALGTPQYMSPETIRCREIDGRSDLFSLAITLFEAITGTNPFKRSGASGALAAVLEVEVDPDPAIPPPLWLVLSRALSKQAYERHANAAEMAAAIRGAVQQIAAPAEPSPRTSEPSIVSSELDVRPKRRKVPSVVLIGAAAGALVLVVAIGLAARPFAGSRPQEPAAQKSPPPPAQPTVNAEVVVPRPATPTTTAPVASTPAKAQKPPPRTKPQPAQTTKPVATTPGF